MTLVVRDEADIIEQQLAFSFAAGVDFVIATDHASSDGTTEILERHERSGVLQLIHESSPDFRQVEWVTRMARLAATELAADWVINSDADEFWWPSGGDLKDVLGRVPSHVGVVQTFARFFPPVHGEQAWYERMNVRFAAPAAVNDPASPFRGITRLLHRASADVKVGLGNHSLHGVSLRRLAGVPPVEVLHFPIRDVAHFGRKYLTHHATLGGRRRGGHVRASEALRSGSIATLYDRLCVDEAKLRRGEESGLLVRDDRLRGALRQLASDAASRLRFRARTPAEQIGLGVDTTVHYDGELVRLRRRLDELERRLAGRDAEAAIEAVR
jgi:Glycosyl transferase family 2